MKPENIMVSEKDNISPYCMFHSYEMLRTEKFIDTKSRLTAKSRWGWEAKEELELAAISNGLSS